MKSNEIKIEIQKLNPALTDEVLDLIYKYVNTKNIEESPSLEKMIKDAVETTRINLKSCL